MISMPIFLLISLFIIIIAILINAYMLAWDKESPTLEKTLFFLILTSVIILVSGFVLFFMEVIE